MDSLIQRSELSGVVLTRLHMWEGSCSKNSFSLKYFRHYFMVLKHMDILFDLMEYSVDYILTILF
jgi:hypothetical protein